MTDQAKNAARQEKRSAFEWQRAMSLNEGNPESHHAAVLMYEIYRLRKKEIESERE
jgi:hypothetical protein